MFSRFHSLVLCSIALAQGGTALADSIHGLDLARSSNCLACHQVDKKRVGPAFTVIAGRFAGQDGAQTYLSNTIRSGGRGRWGAVPMPAQPQVSPEEAEQLAQWILSLQAPTPAVNN